MASENELHVDLGIGVGCFWLGSAPQDYMGASTHFQMLFDQLSEIESITNIAVSGADSEFGATLQLEDNENNDCLYPNTYFTSVAFDVLIPEKVQERLQAKCESERLSVVIYNHYHLPVIYIYSANDVGSFIPSTAVVLMRRYLIEKLAPTKIAFGCIGPSPFHADFWTIKGDESSLTDVTDSVGYKNYIFTYQTSDSAGLSEFMEKYGDDFSLFYYLCILRSKAIALQGEVVDLTESLLDDPQGRPSWYGWISKTLESRALITSASKALFSESMLRAEMKSRINERNEHEPYETFEDLKYHFREVTRFSDEEGHTTAKDIVKICEGRRNNLLQNAAVLVSGLLGGLVGAIFGSMLTFALTNPKNVEAPPRETQAIGSPAERASEGNVANSAKAGTLPPRVEAAKQ